MLRIIDYGSGNIAAIANICQREKIPYRIARQPDELADATHFLLPGVGAFDPTMETLESSGMIAALQAQVIERKKPLLGICVGMQLLADASEEGVRSGLGFIPGRVRRIDTGMLTHPPHLPHMGWNDIAPRATHPLLEGIDTQQGFYFLHSYFFDAASADHVVATVDYGAALPCIVARGNVVGAQFHPEKSHRNGIRLITNFARWQYA
jgi:glutamine amidotransferase